MEIRKILSLKLNNIFITLNILVIFILNPFGNTTILSIFIDPHLKLLIQLILLIITFFIVLIRKGILFDIVLALLILRVPLSLLPVFYINSYESYLSNFMVVLFAPVAYYLGKHFTCNDIDKYLSKVISFLSIIIFVQVLYVFIINYNSLPFYMLKSSLTIPVGQSNYIAAFSLIFLIYTFLNFKLGRLRFIIIFINIITILLTLSDGGLLLLILFIFAYVFLLMNKRYLLSYKSMFFLIFSIIGVSILILNYSYIFESYLKTFSLLLDGPNSFSEASNGRFQIYLASIETFLEHPYIGRGLSKVAELDYNKPHNIFLELLIKGGIIGFLVYIFSLFIIGYKFYISKNIKIAKTLILIIIFSVINGMIENNYMTLSFEFLIWFIYGLGIMKIDEKRRSANGRNNNTKLHVL